MSMLCAEKFKRKIYSQGYILADLVSLEKAIDFLIQKHSGQTRYSKEDYYIHPIEVAEIILDWGYDAPMIIAALLHDSVEDSEVTFEEIQKEFGSEVALHIFAVTNNTISKDSIQKAIKILEISPKSLVIKLADRLHNMRTIKYMSREKQIQKSQETLTLYVPIARHFKMYEVAEELKNIAITTIKD